MKNLFKLSRDKVDPTQFLQLISEKTSPNYFWSSDTRYENRCNRTIAVTVSPWHRNAPVVAPLNIALTKDISSCGICLICPFEILDKEVVIGVYVTQMGVEEPLFFLFEVVRCVPFAAGFWQVGGLAKEMLNTNFRRQMKEMGPRAIKLLTPDPVTDQA